MMLEFCVFVGLQFFCDYVGAAKRMHFTLQKFGISEFLQKPHNYYNLDVVRLQQGTQFRI